MLPYTLPHLKFSPGSVMANLANFPEKYIGHMSSGQGMGGLLPSVVNVIILAFPNSNSQVKRYLFAKNCSLNQDYYIEKLKHNFSK